MIRKTLITISVAAMSLGAFAAAPAQARPRVVCQKVWRHHHLVRQCHHVAPVRYRVRPHH